MYNKREVSNPSVISQLKTDFDWQSYVEENFPVKYAHGRNGLELRICCPHCHEGDFKCYVNPDMGTFNCFKCSFKTSKQYDLFSFISLSEGITKGQALVRTLLQHKPVAPDASAMSRKLLHEGLEQEEEGEAFSVREIGQTAEFRRLRQIRSLAEATEPFKSYLISRGLQDLDLEILGLYIPTDNSVDVPVHHPETGKYKGSLKDRIVIPVYGPDGMLVSYQGRDVTGTSKLKYLTAPGSDLSSTVWPFSVPYEKSVVIVEGVFDALSVRRLPNVSAYATFSKHISKAQIQLFKLWKVEDVILWYDKRDAKQEMIRTVEDLKMQFKNIFVLDLEDWPVDKDTGDLLSDTEGSAIIKETLTKRINVYSLEYERWKTTF